MPLPKPFVDVCQGTVRTLAIGTTPVSDGRLPRALEVNLYKHILIATDGSELAGKAVSAGLTLAKALGAKVTAVNATEPWTAMVTGEAALAFPIEDYE